MNHHAAHILKSLAIAKVELLQMVEFKVDFFVFWFQSFLRGFLMVGFWWVFMGSQGGAPIGNLDRESFILLLVATQILLLPFHGSEAIATMVEAPVIEGRMALILCRPIHPLLVTLARVTCQQFRTMAVAFGLWIITDWAILPKLMGTEPVFILERLPILFVSMLLGSLVNNLLHILIGLTAFWVGYVWSVTYVSGIFSGFLSGQFFPLHLIADLEFWSRFFPYRSIAYSPALIATGQAGWSEIGLQAAMAGALGVLVMWTFNKGLRSFEAAGG